MIEKITAEDLEILRKLKKETKSVFENNKILALISIASGERIETIARVLQLHPSTIRNYVAEWCKKKRSSMNEVDQSPNLMNNKL